jgi:hypothetical protein
VLADISRSGARLDDCSEQPPVGTRVRLYLFVEPAGPFALEGPVVRHTETGFAIAFEIFDVATRRVVEAVMARAAMPATG